MCSVISTIYPQFPTERQFRHSLESLLSSSDPSRSKHFILAQFLDDRERLAVGSALLPDLVEMYLWLDTHVAHLLLYEPALKMTAKYVIEKASERYSSEAKHIHELYERLTSKTLVWKMCTIQWLGGYLLLFYLGYSSCVPVH